jgi:hypothetical protein
MEAELASEMSRLFKKLGNGQSLKRKRLSFNASHALVSLGFLTFEAGTDRLS